MATRDGHPDYAEGKAGVRHAAARLANALLSDAAVARIQELLARRDRRPVVVPVRAIEAAGINLIPDAMAHQLGQRLRLAVTGEIIQTNTVLRCGRGPVKICGRNMANPSNATGRKPSASDSTSSPKPRQGTSFVPRPLTPSEIEWLKREGREFQEEYSRIKAEVEEQRTGQSAAAAGVREP